MTKKMVNFFIADNDGPILLKVYGYVKEFPGNKICLSNSDFDIERIGEILSACGLDHKILIGKRISVTIEESTEDASSRYQGKLAFKRGKYLEDCPYPEGTDENTCWIKGYIDAQIESEKD